MVDDKGIGVVRGVVEILLNSSNCWLKARSVNINHTIHLIIADATIADQIPIHSLSMLFDSLAIEHGPIAALDHVLSLSFSLLPCWFSFNPVCLFFLASSPRRCILHLLDLLLASAIP